MYPLLKQHARGRSCRLWRPVAQVQLRKIDVALFLGSAALAWAGESERAIDGAERALRISPLIG